MPRPIEDHDREIVDLAVERIGDDLQVLRHRSIEVDLALRRCADDELLHVRVRRMEEAATFGSGEDRDRVGPAFCDRVRALERIDRDVDLRANTSTDLLADVQHRRFVTLAFADDDPTVERDLVHRATHCFHGRSVCLVVLTVAHPVGRCDRGGFRNAHKFEARRAVDHVSRR